MKYKFPVYDFPCRLFDFKKNEEKKFDNYRDLERFIKDQLSSSDITQIKNGLSNVLFWGYNRIGYGKFRLQIFRDNVSDLQLCTFRDLVKHDLAEPLEIKKIGMPQFSGFSFVSKILMFLEPSKYVVLDKKIMDLSDLNHIENPLTNIPYKDNDSGIRITKISQQFYIEWCNLCRFIANEYYDNKIAVDIERGFFKLVEENKLNYAKQIIIDEIKNLRVLKHNIANWG